jgi:hypothetical protein
MRRKARQTWRFCFVSESGIGAESRPAGFPATVVVVHAAARVKQGFRDGCVALAERHSHARECASCEEGWDGGDAFEDYLFFAG